MITRELTEVRLGLWCLTPLQQYLSYIWWSVLLVEETGVSGEKTDLSQVTDKLYHQMLYRVHLTRPGFELTTLVVIDHDHDSSNCGTYCN